MDQKEFDQLLKRYKEGNVSEEESALVDHWYHAIEHTPSGITGKEKAVIKQRLQTALDTLKEKPSVNIGHRPGDGHVFMPWARSGWSIAASIILILTVASVFIFIPDSVRKTVSVLDKNIDKWEKIENTASYAHLITLTDGSEITLEPGACVEYPRLFDSRKREIRLRKGSAFFHVKRDEKRPFYVYSYDIVTRVLGTSFTINSDQKGHVTVDVKTGSVSVSALAPDTQRASNPETILTPNQRADYNPWRKKIVRTLVEKPRVVIPLKEVRNMVFQNTSIATIFLAVEKAYNVKIQFDDDIFSECVLTTYLIPEEDLYTRLKIICGAIGATYHEEDGNVIVKGKGC